MSQAQPVEVMYPNPTTAQQQTQLSTPSHSNGSFGPVFIVLAVIIVISAAACVLGRLCNRRKNKEAGHHHHKSNKKAGKNNTKEQGHNHAHNGLGPKEWESRQKPSFNMRDGDIEFGFDHKKIPTAKGVKSGGGGKGKPPHMNGGHRPEVRFADNV